MSVRVLLFCVTVEAQSAHPLVFWLKPTATDHGSKQVSKCLSFLATLRVVVVVVVVVVFVAVVRVVVVVVVPVAAVLLLESPYTSIETHRKSLNSIGHLQAVFKKQCKSSQTLRKVYRI